MRMFMIVFLFLALAFVLGLMIGAIVSGGMDEMDRKRKDKKKDR